MVEFGVEVFGVGVLCGVEGCVGFGMGGIDCGVLEFGCLWLCRRIDWSWAF